MGPFYNLLTYHIAIIPNTIPSIGAPKERRKEGKGKGGKDEGRERKIELESKVKEIV